MRDERPNGYDDIITLPHHVSAIHPQMPLLDRAAQFAPFAALTGHDEAIKETARLTESLVEMDEEQVEKLDRRLRMLQTEIRENPLEKPEIKVIYFRPDTVKAGGAYESVTGFVKKVDEYRRQILFADGTALPMENLFSIEGELFKDMDL